MKEVKCFCVCMLLFFAVAIQSGCGNASQPESISLAVIVGAHSNTNKIPLNSDSIYDALYEVSYSYGEATFINNDGNPKVYFQASIPKPEVSGLSENAKKSDADAYARQLQHALQQAAAQVEEVNTLKAIETAAQALNGAESSDKRLLILDSGVATKGYLNYTQGILNAKPGDIVNELKKKKALPDLTGVAVKWAFCGTVSQPQDELSERQKSNLQDIWQAVLTEAGAEEVVFSSDFSSNDPYSGLPEVSVVKAEDPFIEVKIQESADTPAELMGTIVLGNEKVQFLGDQAEFAAPNKAKSVLKEAADKLLQYSDSKVYLIGSTASGEDAYCKNLSYDRVAAVRDVLAGFGVSENQMILLGLGDQDPWHKPDLNSKGKLIEEIACQNRKVIIMDVENPQAKLLEGFLN